MSMSSSSSPPLTRLFRDLGRTICDEYHRSAHSSEQADGDRDRDRDRDHITPVLCSYAARCITLEQSSRYPELESAGGDQLSPQHQQELIKATLVRLRQKDDPLWETIRMQVSFEVLYSSELHGIRTRRYELDQENARALDKIATLGNTLNSNAQVANLYRAIFKLMLANGCVDTNKTDRNVDREIAAALESVFPQSGLNAFQLQSSDERKTQIRDLINIVLGIRLFNRDIKKGGAGIKDIPSLLSSEVDTLYDRLETESTQIGDVCYTYADVLQLEQRSPGTIAASVIRLQHELINRRQYILLIHQLQHEVLESMDVIREAKHRLQEVIQQLKTTVAQHTSVPKEQVFPCFELLSTTWRVLLYEREKNTQRMHLLQQLLPYRSNFQTSLLEEDVALLKGTRTGTGSGQQVSGSIPPASSFDEFVETMSDVSPPSEHDTVDLDKLRSVDSLPPAYSTRPVRLVASSTHNFMSLPLELQGYCCYTAVQTPGLLLSGNPSLGIIRVLGRYYSFVDIEAMHAFCDDPEKYITQIKQVATSQPALIQLLAMQHTIPNTDIATYITHQEQGNNTTASSSSSASQCSAGCQTPHYINTDIPDPNYCWNEWELRRKAIQMADLVNRRTHSTQTDLSHFKRDNSTQYTLPTVLPDGTAVGVGTQTGVSKGTNVERTRRYIAGLRGAPSTTTHTNTNTTRHATKQHTTATTDAKGAEGVGVRIVSVTRPPIVEEGSNGTLHTRQRN